MREDSSFLICCFSRLANCLDSLHGVRPEISATAGSGADKKRMEESASAAENAWSGDDDFPSVDGVCDAEHTIMDLGFVGVT